MNTEVIARNCLIAGMASGGKSLATALAARRTCQQCAHVQDHYVSALSRCGRCEDVTDYRSARAVEHGWS